MNTTTLPVPEPTALQAPVDEARSTALVESLLDNLPVWAVVAAAIAFLYLVWATLEILSRYVGPLPKIAP